MRAPEQRGNSEQSHPRDITAPDYPAGNAMKCLIKDSKGVTGVLRGCLITAPLTLSFAGAMHSITQRPPIPVQ